MSKLTALGIKKAGPGRYGDGGGLELRIADSGGKWVWRYSFVGKRREMGLGAYPTVSLSDARKERDRWALILSRGKDPISERKAAVEATRQEIEKDDPTLEKLAKMVLEAKKAGLRAGGDRGRWMSPLKTHVFPKIGRKQISSLKPSDIKDALTPIWHSKPPTAEKAIQRLGIVFRQGQLMGYDCEPFTIDAAKHMLGEVLHETKSIAATPWKEIPDLFLRLQGRGNVAACLQFMMLTLVRSDGCRNARFDEFDGDTWIVPADRIKGRVGKVQDFRVPLSQSAQKIIEQQRMFGGEYVFTGHRNQPISDNALSKHMKMMGEIGRPHGFRTSFRTWVQDTDSLPWEVSETILGHKIGGKVERSYARSDLFERRKPAMETWAAYVTGATATDIVPIASFSK